jgi:hypothetical protein
MAPCHIGHWRALAIVTHPGAGHAGSTGLLPTRLLWLLPPSDRSGTRQRHLLGLKLGLRLGLRLLWPPRRHGVLHLSLMLLLGPFDLGFGSFPLLIDGGGEIGATFGRPLWQRPQRRIKCLSDATLGCRIGRVAVTRVDFRKLKGGCDYRICGTRTLQV